VPTNFPAKKCYNLFSMQSVNEREEAADKASAAALDVSGRLDVFRRESNLRVNDVDLLLTMKRGLVEVESGDLDPTVEGAVLLKESVITRLNNDIGVRSKEKRFGLFFANHLSLRCGRPLKLLVASMLVYPPGNVGR
jgi:hypothetical protein